MPSTTTSIPPRLPQCARFLLFGYLEEQGWVWLGTQTEPKHLIDDPEAYANERQTMAVLYDSRIWDSR